MVIRSISGEMSAAGADPGGGGPPNFIQREKTLCACARMGRVLVLNSYADHPPPPFPKSCIRPRAVSKCENKEGAINSGDKRAGL